MNNGGGAETEWLHWLEVHKDEGVGRLENTDKVAVRAVVALETETSPSRSLIGGGTELAVG